MSDDLIQQIADLRRQVGALQRDRITIRAAVVVSADVATRTFAADVAGAGTLTGIPAPAQFLPESGDLVTLRLAGATPILEPERIAVESITADMISADAITGKTITGGILRTAETGQRVEIQQVGGVGAVRMFSGAGGETPGTLTSNSGGLGKAITLDYGTNPGDGEPGPQIVMGPDQVIIAATTGVIGPSHIIELDGNVVVVGSLRVPAVPASTSDAVSKGYVDAAKWTTVYEGPHNYSQTATASLVTLTGMSGSVTVPSGRQLEVEAYLPIVEAPAGGWVRPRIVIAGLSKTAAEVYGAQSVNAPVTLSATHTGTGAAVSFNAAVYGGGTAFGKVRGVGDSTAPGPRLRYRII